MPQSIDNILLHLVFSTKDRFPFLGANDRSALHAYLAAVVRNAGADVRGWEVCRIMSTSLSN